MKDEEVMLKRNPYVLIDQVNEKINV